MSLMGKITYFLDLRIKKLKDGIFISQRKYAKNLFKRFVLEKAYTKRPSAPTHVKMSKDSNGPCVDKSLCRNFIESLLYVTTSRLDIVFAAGVYARYQAKPNASHLLSVKQIMKYIRGRSLNVLSNFIPSGEVNDSEDVDKEVSQEVSDQEDEKSSSSKEGLGMMLKMFCLIKARRMKILVKRKMEEITYLTCEKESLKKKKLPSTKNILPNRAS
ncbi:uncharacterized protein LOC120090715 [Benincasa hispida]|uniref:uncharacterized protein LOC120090715 n=1 Tax=Benincasa hispida TaxID=102211 RepID=UPI001900EBFA|nr:uncharacterized protein LOC120090715 [Benincasa hispida]